MIVLVGVTTLFVYDVCDRMKYYWMIVFLAWGFCSYPYIDQNVLNRGSLFSYCGQCLFRNYEIICCKFYLIKDKIIEMSFSGYACGCVCILW